MFEEDAYKNNVDSALQGSRKTRGFPAQRFRSTYAQHAQSSPSRPARPRRRVFWLRKKFWLWLFILTVVACVGLAGNTLIGWGEKIFSQKNPFSLVASFGQLLTGGDKKLAGEDRGEVNILLLGIGGEGHEGALLTDTMILATIHPGANGGKSELALLSIPRDFVAKLPIGSDLRKINSAYAYGEMKQTGLGQEWARQAVEEWTGKNIPYYALVDFSGFKQAIDDLGGIDLYVDNAFSDSSYPDNKNGYLPTLRFQQGLQHMDGERALEFSRSRHGTNGEGSDFARSKRQQKILSAVKDKVVKLRLSSDLGTIGKLTSNFADHFKTNLEPWGIKRAYDLLHDTDQSGILSLSLDPSTGLICSEIAPETGAYILEPCAGYTKQDIKDFISNEFNLGRVMKESPKIVIQNSTKIASLALRAQAALDPYGIDVSVGNYPDAKTQFDSSVIYDLSGNSKPKSLEYLKDNTGITDISKTYPFPDKLGQDKPDFVIVLGLDMKDKFPELKPKPVVKTVPEPAASATTASSTKTGIKK